MNKLWLMLLVLPSMVYANTASTVQEGVYIDTNGKRLSLSFYEQDGLVQYMLAGVYPAVNGALLATSTEIDKIKNNQSTVFSIPDNPYYDEVNYCQIEVSFFDGKMILKPNQDCSDELSFRGQYAYSKHDSSVPAKYWGAWGEDCSEPSFIKKDSFSGNGYYRYGLLDYEENSKGITLYGYSIEEGILSDHYIEYTKMRNGNVKIAIDYGGEEPVIYKLPQCTN